jgi:hypothetical protein
MDFFLLWMAHNEALHGHNQPSQQQQAHLQKLCLEMELLHAQHIQVIKCNTDVFISKNPADLTQYLDMATALQVQNWLDISKPFILSSVK